MEVHRSTDEFIIALFIRVDTVMADVPKDSRAHLYPSEVVTLALLFALKGVGPRAFNRWLRNNSVVSTLTGAHAAVSPVCRTCRLGRHLLSPAHDARRDRQLWH